MSTFPSSLLTICALKFSHQFAEPSSKVYRRPHSIYYNSIPSSALLCPCEEREAHVATVNQEIGYWTCTVNREECGKLTPLQLLWLDNTSSEGTDIQRLTESPHLALLMTKLSDHASKWREIGSNLGFREGELDNIQSGTQHQDAPKCYMRTMLSQWLQWAPRDNRRSSSFATCLLYTSPSPRDATLSRMPSSA